MPVAKYHKQRRVRRGAWKPRWTKQRINWRGTTKSAVAPTLASITPNTAVSGGGNLTVTLTGTNFVAATKAMVNGGDVATTYVSATSITCVVPASMMLAPTSLSISAHTGDLQVPTPRTLTIT